MSEPRLEKIVHMVVAKPIAWTLYLIWLAMKWVGRCAVNFGRLAWRRWAEFKQRTKTRGTQVA